jgi:ABC-type transport system involved in multi-copper enzyme maturation permease subunit
MLRDLLAKELLDIFKTTKFLVAFAAYVVLIPIALYTGEKHYESRASSYRQALGIYESSLKGSQGSLDIKPQILYRPSNLMVLSRDMIPYFPQGYVITATEGTQISAGKIPPGLFEKMFGDFDLLFVLTALVSLLSVLVVYDSVSGEKDRGTLRLVLSYQVPRSKLFLAKYLGPLFASTMCLLAGYLIGLVVLVAFTSFAFDTELLITFGTIFLLTVLYCSVSLLLGLAVSTFTHKPTNSLLVAIMIWILFVLVVPRLGVMAAENIVKTDSAETLNLKQEQIRKSLQEQQNNELKPIFGSPNYGELRQPIAERYQQETTRLVTELEDNYMRSRARQEQTALLFSSLSPVSHITSAVTEMTNTGYNAMLGLLKDVRLYQSTIASSVYSKGFRDQIPNVGVKMVYAPVELDQVPRFVQSQASLSERISRSLTPILVLALFNVALFVLTYVKGINYDPR